MRAHPSCPSPTPLAEDGQDRGWVPSWARLGKEGGIASCRNPAWLPPSSSPWAPQAWPGDPPASAWPKCLPLPPRLSRETLAYREELDILKFLCKDLWMAVFQKQMDSLRTNHQVCACTRAPAS